MKIEKMIWLFCVMLLGFSVLPGYAVGQEVKACVITGDLPGEDGMAVELITMKGMTRTIATAIVQEGKFELNVDLKQDGVYGLSFPDKTFSRVWLSPGKTLTLKKDETLDFGGVYGERNTVLNRLLNKYSKENRELMKVNKLSPEHSGKLRDIYNKQSREVEASGASREDQEFLKGYFQGELLHGLYWSTVISKVFGKTFKRPEVEDDYSDIVMDMDFSHELVNHPNWFEDIQEWISVLEQRGKVIIGDRGSYLADMAKAIHDRQLRETFVMEYLQMEFMRGYTLDIDKRVEAAEKMVKREENKARLQEMKVKAARLQENPGVLAPGADLSIYEFEDLKGEKVRLADFKGKYIFIDIWSTGCNPCVGEISYIHDLEQRFAGKPIEWVSISTDHNKDVWRKFVAENGMKGVQVISQGAKDPFAERIGLGGIPRFLLLDTEGRVIDYESLRPSCVVSGELLEKLLD